MPHGLSCPKPSASSLKTASHLGTGSGTRAGRGGTLLVSGLLLLSGRCALGRPGGLLGGSPSLQGSNAQQDRGGWLGPLQSKGFAPFLSCPTSQKASLCPSQDQCCRLQHRCLTGFAPAPRGARLTVFLLFGPGGGCHGVRWAQGGLSTALWAVKT